MPSDSPVRPPVLVRKLKYDGSLKSEWEGEALPVPQEGWLAALHHPRRHRKSQGGRSLRADRYFVHCLHTARPLTVLLQYGDDGAFEGAKCDAALPAVRRGPSIEFVDLDLDLVVGADFSFRQRDEDAFGLNGAAMGYSAGTRSRARRGIEEARRLVTARLFPFGDTVAALAREFR